MKIISERLQAYKSVYAIIACFFSFVLIGTAQNMEPKKAQSKNKIIVKPLPVVTSDNKLIQYNGNDGPYIVNDTLYRVNSRNKLIKTMNYDVDSLVVRIDNFDSNEFHLALNEEYQLPKSIYELPQKMLVISDIEGNYEAFVSFLSANKVIDKNHNWIFEDGHLVLVGDFVDRGKNVTQILWLIYKLEYQAAIKDGQVHFILGNHEILNFQGNHKYNNGKYIKVAQRISGEEDKTKAIKYLYSEKSEIGKWLATKNVIEKIGGYLFVHAGLSPEILKFDLSLEEINTLVRAHYFQIDNTKNKKVDFLYGNKGPFWYRGLVIDRLDYKKIKLTELDAVLSYYAAEKIVIGHTVVNTISTDFKGKVIRIDVSHGSKKFSGRTKGLRIENGREFIVDDQGRNLGPLTSD